MTPSSPGIAITPATQPLPLLSRSALALALTVVRWQTRLRTRRSLAGLDRHRLIDIGLDPDLVALEISKPFWRG